MAITYIGGSGLTGSAVNLPSYNQPAGECIVLVCSGQNTLPANYTFQDTAGNTFTFVDPGLGGFMINDGTHTFGLGVWVAANCLGNASNVIQFKDTGSLSFGTFFAYHVTNALTSSPADIMAHGSSSAGSTALATGSYTTGQAAEAAILATVCPFGYQTVSLPLVGGLAMSLDGQTGNGGNEGSVSSLVLSSIQTTQTAGATGGSSTPWLAGLVTIKLAASTHSISGSAGVAGANVAYSGTASGNVTADGSGNYTISGLADGSYTITPTLTGYTFSPTSSNQTLAGSNITGVNFTATQTQVATSTFSPVAGTYTGTQSVTLANSNSGLSGFAQYYTTDGTNPTTGSTLYTGAISVATSLTIKVLATATSYANSNIASAAYVINAASGAYSVPDCRKAPFGPNASRTVQGTKIYDVQTSNNPAVPGTDSRKAGAPMDCRKSPNIPQNSRTPGTYGPNE